MYTDADLDQGFEGLTISPDRKKLYVLIQSALNQEGGLKNKQRRNARFVVYDLTKETPEYNAEYVVPLPTYDNGTKVAAQSEIHFISDKQFLVLARDSNSGRGQSSSLSVYRHADVFDISNATDLKSSRPSVLSDAYDGSIAPNGVLPPSIVPAKYCPWLDFNVNSQLNRFGVHNGGSQDRGLLNEKWESLALLPVNLDGQGDEDEYFFFSFSDNDFITQNGIFP